jgi:PTH1 family peptidyl-tRNA hydrolase
MVLDRLAVILNTDFDKEKHQGLIAQANHGGEKLLLVKPLTFMNQSGECVAPVARNKIFSPDKLLVVVDDIDLAVGKLRIRATGSAGGHNGLKSIIERIGSKDFHRLRLGVGDDRDQGNLADHVLSKFRPDEKDSVQQMIDRAAEATLVWVESDVDQVMNAFN